MPGGRFRSRHRAGQSGRQPADPGGSAHPRGPENAPQGEAHAGHDPRSRTLDRPGAPICGGTNRAGPAHRLRQGQETLGLPTDSQAPLARPEESRPHAISHRCLHPGPARSEGLDPFPGRRAAHLDSPPVLRSDRAAAGAGGSRCVRASLAGRQRETPGRHRTMGRSAAGLAALRRALGPALARRRPLCRHQGLRLRGASDRMPYAYTYRDYVIRAFNEDMPYDRSSMAAARRRPDRAQGRTVASGRDGLSDPGPPVHRQSARHHRRSDRHGHARPAGFDGHLCPLPRSQV